MIGPAPALSFAYLFAVSHSSRPLFLLLLHLRSIIEDHSSPFHYVNSPQGESRRWNYLLSSIYRDAPKDLRNGISTCSAVLFCSTVVCLLPLFRMRLLATELNSLTVDRFPYTERTVLMLLRNTEYSTHALDSIHHSSLSLPPFLPSSPPPFLPFSLSPSPSPISIITTYCQKT